MSGDQIEELANQFLIDNKDNWVMCMFAVYHSEKEYIKDQLIRHTLPGGYYLLSQEVAKDSHKETNGEHFHVMAQMTNEAYGLMSMNIKRKYNLRGKAVEGKPRQYGKVAVKKLLEAISYTGKDGIWESNIPADLLAYFHNKSYTKSTNQEGGKKPAKSNKSWLERTRDELLEMYPDHKWCHSKDMEIIRRHMRVCLGRKVGLLNKYRFRDMYWAIFQTLPMEYEESMKIDESLDEAISDRL